MRALDALHSQDQASGLRRLLQSAPPRMLALVNCSRATTPWLAAQLRLRAVAGVRMLVLDEAGSLSTALAGRTLADLLDAVDGRGEPADWLACPLAGLQLARVKMLALRFGQDRICRQRTLRLFEVLRLGCDEWILSVGPEEARAGSAFGKAADRMLLLLDGEASSARLAYSLVKKMLADGFRPRLAVCYAGAPSADGWRVAHGFADVLAGRLGVEVMPTGSLGEAQLLDAREGGGCVDAYLARLVQTGGRACVAGQAA